jgi:hypothetical protein
VHRAERLDVVASAPGPGRHRLPVAVADVEGATRWLELLGVDGGVVGAAVAHDVLGLDLGDEPLRVLVRQRDAGDRVHDGHQ